MGLYDYISGITVLIYFFMFLIILNGNKTSIRNAFLGLIAISIMWTGGSLLMRRQALPSYEFWYHISLFGIFLMPVLYFKFIMEYTLNVKKILMYVYGTLMSSFFFVNLLTGFFIPPPIIEVSNGVEVMVYRNIGSSIYIMYIAVGLMIIHMFYWFYKEVKGNPSMKGMIIPITVGISALFIGNLFLVIPAFQTFPIDILGGLVNAFALFFALTKRNPFKLKMLMSESVGYATCFLLGFLTLLMLNPIIIASLNKLNVVENTWTVWYLGIFSLLLILYLTAWRMIIFGVFIKEEEEKVELLNQFSATVTTSLDSKYIFESSMDIIDRVVGSFGIYFALKTDDYFQVVHSNFALADFTVKLNQENPILQSLTKEHTCAVVKECKENGSYQEMNETDKKVMKNLETSHVFGLIDAKGIYGLLLISDIHAKKGLRHQDILRIQSICTMVSIALKNAASYEKAIIESQTDNLTGLFNRNHFYNQIDKSFIEEKDNSIALVMINLDDFKLYNQLYGVKKSDRALQVISSILRDNVGKNGCISRFSGKEFTIILPRYDVRSTLKLVESINNQIKEYVTLKTKELEKLITTSVGICVYPFGADNASELIENVQQAIYQIKRNGKNNVQVFETFVNNNQDSEKRSISSIYDEHKSTIYALTAAIDAKDHYTFSHSENVAKYAVAFANKLNLNKDIIENIRQAALLHDIGKIAIPEHVLNKPGKLTKGEFKLMQGHVDASIDIIRHLPSLDYVIPAVLGHHERYDGTGYPRRISGEDIPLTARILCLADSVDAMLSKRSYKTEKTVEEVIEIVQTESGKQFDPNLSKLFTENFESIIK